MRGSLGVLLLLALTAVELAAQPLKAAPHLRANDKADGKRGKLLDTWSARLAEDARARENWRHATWHCSGDARDKLVAADADSRGVADTYVLEVQDATQGLPSARELAESVGGHKAPAVLRSAVQCIGGFQSFSLEGVRLHMAHEGDVDVFDSVPKPEVPPRRMPFSAFLKRAANGEHLYVAGADLPRKLVRGTQPSSAFLRRALGPMGFGGSLLDVELFVQAGTTENHKNNVAVTPLHRDSRATYLAVVFGTKHVRLFSPRMRKHLYPTRDPEHGVWGDERSLLPSPLEDGVPESQFPCYAHARSTLVTLHAGDALVIPEGWWHEVTTLGASIALSYRYDDAGAESAIAAAHDVGEEGWTCTRHHLRRGTAGGWDNRRDSDYLSTEL